MNAILSRLIRSSVILGISFLSLPLWAAERVVPLSGRFALLNEPTKSSRFGLVLFTGGDGYVGISEDGRTKTHRNWIIRTRGDYAKSGVSSLLVDKGADVFEAINLLKKRGVKEVYLVGMSRGCHRALDGISGGISGIIFVSCRMDEIRTRLGSPERMPRTLVIHHRQDRCRGTAPYKVSEFSEWAGARARIIWNQGGIDEGEPCGPDGYHGHKGVERTVISEIVRFVIK